MRLFFTILLLFFGLALQAQSPYAAQWAEIDSLIDSVDQPRLAQERLMALERRADRDGNDPMYLKAFLRRLELESVLNPKADSIMVVQLEQTLSRTKQPARKAILHLTLARVWTSWLQHNFYRIISRSKDQPELAELSPDFRLWKPEQFADQILHQYEMALEEGEALSRIPVRSYAALLDTIAGSDRYRPTLYDLTAQTIFEWLARPSLGMAFWGLTTDLPPARLFAERRIFLQEDFGTSEENVIRCLKLVQTYLRFRDNLGDPYPLVQADLQRLAFLKEMYPSEQRDAPYKQGLEWLAEEYGGHPVRAEVEASLLHLAWENSAHLRQSDQRQSYDQRLLTAHARGMETIESFPETRGATTCQQIIHAIEKAELSFQLESFVLPNAAFRARLSFRNLDKVYFRAIRLSNSAQKQWDEIRRGDLEKARNFLRRQPYRRTWSHQLPEVTDYYPRSTEIAMPPLDPGTYILLASEDARFSTKAKIFAYSTFQATRMAFELVSNRADNSVKALLRNRKKGSPIARQRLTLYRNNNTTSRPDSTLYTNKQGAVVIPALSENGYWRFALKARRGSDQISFEGNGWKAPKEQNSVQAHIFTDRAIYRPGQPIYAKVLLYQRMGDQFQILANQAVDIEFRDANGQVVEKRPLRTNGYGSAHTSFVAPDDRLLGQMMLKAMNQRAYFRVEEYKRPSFKVEIEIDSAKLGDSVFVSGHVKSYAGAPLAHTEVKLQIRGQKNIPYWFRRYYQDARDEAAYRQDMVVQTNSEGHFTASVIAPAKPSGKGLPVVYLLNAEAIVTDIAGETQAGDAHSSLDNLGYSLDLELPEEIDKSLGAQLAVSLLSSSGKGVKRNLTVEIAPIAYPLQPLRPRKWQATNVHTLDKEAYKKVFPFDVYEEADLQENWSTGVPLVQTTVSVDSSLQWEIPGLEAAPPGLYRLSLFIPADSLTLTRDFTLINPYQKRVPVPAWLDAKLDTQSAQPGQTIHLSLTTSRPEVWTRLLITEKNNLPLDTLIRVPRGQTIWPIPITEQHRGGFNIQTITFAENASHQSTLAVEVPWINKQLKVNWTRIRRKLGPGEATEWELTISGVEADPVAAEMVGSLYDASLESLAAHRFSLFPYPSYQRAYFPLSSMNPQVSGFRQLSSAPAPTILWPYPGDEFSLLEQWGGSRFRRYKARAQNGRTLMSTGAAADVEFAAASVAESPGVFSVEEADENASPDVASSPPIPIRSDFRETAYWGPQLQTDKEGRIKFRFTMPEALTAWRFLGWAHTKDMQIGSIEDEVITQKDLMITTNLPRFMRATDEITLQAKIDNRSMDAVEATVWLELIDPTSGARVEQAYGLDTARQRVQIGAEGAGLASWSLRVPTDYNALQVRAYARGGTLTDAEEHTLPILPARILVRESQPFFIPAGQKKAKINFDKLVHAGRSKTLQHRSLTLDLSSNPAWYAVKALPYLMEFPHECTEQLFSRYYAYAVAGHLLETQPRLAAVFQQWKNLPDSAGFEGQLASHPELKSILLEETPWMGAAQNESERRKHLVRLFDAETLASDQAEVWAKLAERQADNGSMSWFPGLGSNRYITQLIATGLGELRQVQALPKAQEAEIRNWLAPTLTYLDRSMLRDFNAIQIKGEPMENHRPGPAIIQYLYMRSHFRDIAFEEGAAEANTFFLQQATRYWTEQSPYMQGMLAIIAYRSGNLALADLIIAALQDKAVQDELQGMYWVQNGSGYYWHEAQLEQQAFLIRAFSEVSGDPETLDALKQWLLQNKRGNDWGNTRTTVSAVQALLLTGRNWLVYKDKYNLELGGDELDIKGNTALAAEAGTGHISQTWAGPEVKPNMGKLTIRKRPKTPMWGALHWQYSEEIDQISQASTALKIERGLYTEVEGKLVAVDQTQLEIGDEITVRLVVRSDRELEYIHLKDLRAAGLDLIESLSGPRYQDGISYYQQQNDAAVHFFFDRLPAGQWVLEYPLRVRQAGNFAHGVSTLECMYAPEFKAQTPGLRLLIQSE